MELNYKFIIRKRAKTNGGASYQLILSYRDRDGKWKQKSKGGYALRSLAASDKEKEKLLAAARKAGDIDPVNEGMTLREFSDLYLSGRKELAENSLMLYEWMTSVSGSLLDKPMMDITYTDMFTRLHTLPFGENTKKGWVRHMKHLFKEAVKYRVISISPISDLTYKPRMDEAGEASRIRTMTAEEISYLLTSLHEENLEMWILMTIAAYTGARVGELLALTMGDVDFETRSISFNKQFSRVHKYEMGVKRMKSKNSCRTVPIPRLLYHALVEYRDFRVLYFHGRLTKYRHGETLNTILRKYLPAHSMHDFRHTYATRLLSSGVDIKTVASLLGDTITTVERVYIHYTDEMRAKAARDVDRIFGS